MSKKYRPLSTLLSGVLIVTMPFTALANLDTVEQSTVDVSQAKLCVLTDNLSLGARGAQVRCLQEALHKAGYLTPTATTGYFGPITKRALSKWQSENNIPANGYFGPITRAAFTVQTTPTTAAHAVYKALEDSHKAMMAAFTGATTSGMHMDMPDDRKVIAVVLYDEFEPLDAVGPLEVLGQLHGYKVVTVAKQKGPITSALGTKIVADYSFDELKNPAIIVVPGGLFGTIAASKDSATLAWLREADKTSEYTTSVCTGSWILGAAGLLNGRQASTHWTGEDYLEDFGVQYSGKRYTVDGKYVTGAGVSAGIDMSFKLVEMLEGEAVAKVAQLGLEYDPQPPFDAGSPAKADPELVRIMRSMMLDHVAAAKSMVATPATMATSTSNMTGMAGMSGNMHAHMMTNVSGWPAVPTLTAKAHPDTMGGWNLELITTNFTFAPEHVGTTVLPSEGHAHLYIDGVKIGRIYGPWYNLPPTLFKGAGDHEIRVTLNANDHSDLESNGAVIQSIVRVTTSSQ